MVFGGVLEVGGATLGAMLAGLEGLSIAWLIASSVQVFFMAPAVYRVAAGSPALNPQTSGRFGHESAEHAEA
jgi:hypothetical protein